MADLGFLPAVSQILDTVPDRGQRLLFSATLDNAIDRLVRNYLHEPVTHQVDTGQASVPLMSHHLVSIAPQHKAVGDRRDRQSAGPNVDLRPYPARGRPGGRAAASQRGAGRGSARRPRPGRAHQDHVGLQAWFASVLVATDVAARGIHVDEVGLVLHADPPSGPRSICTGRGVLPGRAGPAPSSPSHCRTSVASLAV